MFNKDFEPDDLLQQDPAELGGPDGHPTLPLSPLHLRFEPAAGSAAEVEGAAELAGMFGPIA